MPFYIMPVDWGAPEKGFAYTTKEFNERIANHIEVMSLVPGTKEHEIINQIEFMELDKLFNNAPN